MKTILCPIDFSPTANDGIQYAQHLAAFWHTPTRIILLHAYYMPVLDPNMDAYALPAASLEYENESMARLQSLREQFMRENPATTIEYQTKVCFSEAAEAVARVARQEKVELTVMGTAGSYGISEITAGSVAADVIKEAQCPVLVVPEAISFKPLKRIVVAADLEGDLPAQFNQVVELAQLFDAEIFFLHILTGEKVAAKETARAGFNKIYSGLDYENVSFHYNENENVEEGIVRFVRQQQADLLVMVPHPRHTFKDLFRRSHTKQLAFRSEIPLLAIHP